MFGWLTDLRDFRSANSSGPSAARRGRSFETGIGEPTRTGTSNWSSDHATGHAGHAVTPVTVPQPTEVTEVTEVEAKQVTEVEAASNSFSTDRGNEGNKGNTEFDATGAASRGSADFLPRTLEELQVDGEGEIGTEPVPAPTAPLPDGRADESPSVKKAMLLLPEGAISPKANIEPEAGTGATGSASPKSPVSPTPSNTSNRPSSAAPSGLELSSLDLDEDFVNLR